MSLGKLTVWSPEVQNNFLLALAESGSVTSACSFVSISRACVYNWRRDDKMFAALWEAALELGCDALEDEAVRRGKDGYDKPIYQGGIRVGYVREFSDTLLIFMLKGRRPEKFRERASIDLNVSVDLAGRVEQGRKRVITG